MNRLLLTLTTASNSAASSLRSRAAPASPAALRCRRLSVAAPPADDGADAVRADAVRAGVVASFRRDTQYGFVTPDGEDPRGGDPAFFHARNVVRAHPAAFLRKGQRVQFRLGPPREGTARRTAREVTLEGGAPVPRPPRAPPRGPPRPPRAGAVTRDKMHERLQMARFGDAVFDVAARAGDREEMEAGIVAAYDLVRAHLEGGTGGRAEGRKEDASARGRDPPAPAFE